MQRADIRDWTRLPGAAIRFLRLLSGNRGKRQTMLGCCRAARSPFEVPTHQPTQIRFQILICPIVSAVRSEKGQTRPICDVRVTSAYPATRTYCCAAANGRNGPEAD